MGREREQAVCGTAPPMRSKKWNFSVDVFLSSFLHNTQPYFRLLHSPHLSLSPSLFQPNPPSPSPALFQHKEAAQLENARPADLPRSESPRHVQTGRDVLHPRRITTHNKSKTCSPKRVRAVATSASKSTELCRILIELCGLTLIPEMLLTHTQRSTKGIYMIDIG